MLAFNTSLAILFFAASYLLIIYLLLLTLAQRTKRLTR